MTKASRDKGKRGERLFVRFLRALGLSTSREGWKQSGDSTAGDVVSQPRWISTLQAWSTRFPAIHWEVKNRAHLPPKTCRNDLMQARAVAQGGPCAVAYRIPGTSNWGIYLETSDWSFSDFGLEHPGAVSK